MLKADVSSQGPAGALKVCVLTDEDYRPWTPGPYFQDFSWELYYLNGLNAASRVKELAQRSFDLFVNMCDSNWSEPYPGPEVIRALEEAGVAFTGADSAFYDPSREQMKRVCRWLGIHTPAGFEVRDAAEIVSAASKLAFPLFIKIPNSFGSTGIEPGSRVESLPALQAQAGKVIANFGSALIEEYIDGREFTVLLAENPEDRFVPKAYPPIEFIFPPGESFKHFNLKWIDWEQLTAKPVEDPALALRLMDAGRKLFSGLNGVSYGRCDMRMNAAGEIFILEINPNCGIFYAPNEPGSADFVLMNDPEGHRGFIDRIFKAALARRQRLQPSFAVRFLPGRGEGLVARRAIHAGETILTPPRGAPTLVSLEEVQNHWPAELQRHFFQNAYPLTEETWIVPPSSASQWTPLQHSCDPNAWWEGLDVRARRSIEAGEAITLDYATFHNERMPSFSCQCAAADCRKVIHGSDYRLPQVERYAGHVTEYIKQKRKQPE